MTTTVEFPGWFAGAARTDADALAEPTPATPFDPASLDGLPAAAHRWLTHALPAGTPIHTRMRLAMTGSIKLGPVWAPFRAVEVFDPGRAFVWVARAGWPFAWIDGSDRYTRGTGEMAWKLYGRIPFLSVTGADTDRSAAGRAAGEALMFPQGALDPAVRWEHVDDERATARIDLHGDTHEVTVTVDGEGVLRHTTFPRWGNPGGRPHGWYPFDVRFDGETVLDGVAYPGPARCGWQYQATGWDGEFFRYRVTAVDPR